MRLPSLGQPSRECSNDGLSCLISGGGPPPPWGSGPPPLPDPEPPAPSQPPQPGLPPGLPQPPAPPGPTRNAAAGIGRAIIGSPIKIGDEATIFGAAMTLTSDGNKVPPYQPTNGVGIYRWTGTDWSPEGPATAACSGGICRLTAELQHASTWAFLAPLPAFYPDLTAPALTNLQISEDGLAWSAPGALIQSTAPFARLTARDPPSGIELISGLAVSTSPTPFTSLDPATTLLLHFDDGAGAQALDSGPFASTANFGGTPAWVAGRFGTALEFLGSQTVVAPVASRVDRGPFTVETWVYPTDNAGSHEIAGKGGGVNSFFSLGTTNGRLTASVAKPNQVYTLTSPEPLALNQWSLVAMSFDGSRLRIFINGEQRGDMAAAYRGSGTTLIIGSNWRGRIDELRVLTRVPTRAEMALDYRRGLAANLEIFDQGDECFMADSHRENTFYWKGAV